MHRAHPEIRLTRGNHAVVDSPFAPLRGWFPIEVFHFPIRGYDQDAWAERLRYDAGDPRELLEELRVLRGRNLRLVRSLSKPEWQRYGMHAERGKETVDRQVRMIAGHDRVHLRQIERIKTALGLGNSAP